jgi:hypothetical protein
MVLAACGGSDDRVDDFVGTWTYQAGSSATTDCDDDMLDSMDTPDSMLMLAAGTSSDLIEVPESGDTCPALRLDVDGGTAKAQSGQTCTETLGTAPDTLTVMVTINSYTLTLDSAGTKLTLAGRASAMFTGALTATCTVTMNGTAMKGAARVAGEPRVMWTDALLRRLR